MYSLTRCSTPQDAPITSGKKKVVSITKGRRDAIDAQLVGQPAEPDAFLDELEVRVRPGRTGSAPGARAGRSPW